MKHGITATVRDQCAWVAARARHVRIERDLIPMYAVSLPAPPATDEPARLDPEPRARLAAYWLTLDAINFGSGWFPTIRKPGGRSGYFTIADALRRRFDRQGAWTAGELAEVSPAELARVLGQDPEHELMALFAESLHDLGSRLEAEHDSSFVGPVLAAEGSAVRLVEILAGWSCFSDSSAYDGVAVPFLKRAQIAAADLSRAGVAAFADLDQLTMFADNLVPHVLRLEGILVFEPELVSRIDRGELIEHGSPEEVEIRACAVHAVELIVAASPVPTTPSQVDQLLWSRGQLKRYKASPRHRSRCTAY